MENKKLPASAEVRARSGQLPCLVPVWGTAQKLELLSCKIFAVFRAACWVDPEAPVKPEANSCIPPKFVSPRCWQLPVNGVLPGRVGLRSFFELRSS